jgi:hypothetical protein
MEAETPNFKRFGWRPKIMKKFLLPIIVILALTCQVNAQVKLAQTGFQYLSVGQDARAVGMGEAYTCMEGVSSGMFYNPASLTGFDGMIDVTGNYFTWIADIKYMSFTLGVDPWDGLYGTFGLSVQSVDYGDFYGTIVWPNENGFLPTEIFNPTAIAIGFAYAKALSEKFSVGGQIKWVSQQLGKSTIPGEGTKKNVADVVAFDFGTIYKTGFESLTFGMSVRNFSREIKFEQEGFQLPLTFKLGLSINAFDFTDIDPDMHSILVLVDAVHPRAFKEYVNLGTEYSFLKTFAVRVGYITAQDDYGFTAGFGLRSFGFEIDYAYAPFDIFEDVHRFTLRFTY